MQLSSRILTALAVLILAVAVVAVRTGSPGTVEAATGVIDVLNVGTCYTTSDDVFSVGDCKDGVADTDSDDADSLPDLDNEYEVLADVNDPAEISEVGTVSATYSHDPKTAADSPRGILQNADLVKVSISDTGRDKRTPVVLPVGAAPTELDADDFELITDAVKNIEIDAQAFQADPAVTAADRTGLTAETVVEFTAEDETKTYTLASNMYWGAANNSNYGDRPSGSDFDFDAGAGREPGLEGLKVVVDPAADPAIEYLPMHAAEEGAVFDFYGYVDDGATDPVLAKLGSSALVPDEDRGSGRTSDELGGSVAPWLNVIINDGNVVLQYIVYYTSEREVLAGGRKASVYGGANNPTDDQVPDFTKGEGADTASESDDVALVVQAKADGNVRTQNLWLRETGRFTGRYEGFFRLTDPDGDGSVGESQDNWGLELQNASGPGLGDADVAVLGVESGPVLVEYRDTDGKSRNLSISIDTVPPAVQIDVPAHKERGRDTTPAFAGSYADAESGLREESFRLYVDNSNDTSESGVNDGGESAKLALDLTVDENTDASGYVRNEPIPLRSIDQYAGFAPKDDDTEPDDGEDQFGVLAHNEIYGLESLDDELQHIEGDRHSDGAPTGTFGDSVRIRIEETVTVNDVETTREIDEYNNTIDFHALVADVAGNIGFSDSDDTGPRFINDYGKGTTGSDTRKPGRYNVFGWYARHVFFLDEKEPEIQDSQTVTGFYGINESKKPAINRSGILVAFDGAVDADTIGVDTFEVTLDAASDQSTGATANVIDATANGREVYLLLGAELASDATPSLKIATGKSISDPAGNKLSSGGELTADGQTVVETNDGIAPILSVALSGGSGTGEDNEGPDKLTKEAMTITITSDEEIHTTPAITVVCTNIAWTVTKDDKDEAKELSDYTGARSGALKEDTAAFDQAMFGCGSGADEDIQQQQVKSFSRPGLEWEFQWQNFDPPNKLPDGKITVVAYGRDRRSYSNLDDDKRYNWGAATSEFNLDTTKPVLDPTPADGSTVTDTRPFILLNYEDKSSVAVSKLEFDDTAQEVTSLGGRRYLYWPAAMELGKHSVAVEAVDAAGNETGSNEFSFTVAARKDFDLKLIAGWNAVSVPANPIDPSIESVFTEDVIDMVAAWDASDPAKPWNIATKMEGKWSTHDDFATLTRITARYGYWVHAQGFVTQQVALVGKSNRESADLVPPDLVEIPTIPGWNFVGVIDQEGDQTEDDFGDKLATGDTEVSASSYLGSHAVRSYTWDPIRSRFDILEGDDKVEIGQGIWVYFGEGIAP